MLVLPLTVVWRLHMKFWQKIALSGVFALGALTMIASIVRLTLFFHLDGTDPMCKFFRALPRIRLEAYTDVELKITSLSALSGQ